MQNHRIYKVKDMKNNKLLKILSLVMVICVVFSFSSCKKEEDNSPKEGERLSDLLEVLIPAVVENQTEIVFNNSFVNMNEAFNYMIVQSGVELPKAYKKLSQEYGQEITRYTDALKIDDSREKAVLLNRYGGDYKVTYEIIEDVVLDSTQKDEKIKKIKEKLHGDGDGVGIEKFFDENLATEFHKIDFDYTISGSLRSINSSEQITVCLYDGKWVYADEKFF